MLIIFSRLINPNHSFKSDDYIQTCIDNFKITVLVTIFFAELLMVKYMIFRHLIIGIHVLI